MVLKCVHMKLRTEEVPIRFLKDREGRLSHHKRSGWFSPWAAAWINLRAMFVYGAGFFLYRPGFVLADPRVRRSRCRSRSGRSDRPHHLLDPLDAPRASRWRRSDLQCIYMGILAQIFFDYSGEATKRWFARFPYTRTVAIAAATLPCRARAHRRARDPLGQPPVPAQRRDAVVPPGSARVAPHRRRLHDVHVHVAPPLDCRGRVAAPVNGDELTRGDDRTPDN